MFSQRWDRLRDLFQDLVGSPQLDPPGEGLHHFPHQENGQTHRLHLRIEGSGHGTLLVNANRFLHLNPTAALMAYYHLSGYPVSRVLPSLKKMFHVSKQKAEKDYRHLTTDIENFLNGQGKPFYAFTELELKKPFSHTPSAPYRMDLAVTYRCNNDCPHCYNARERTFPELPTWQWKRILDRLWDLHIPHVVFTGGEPTLREDLPELIRYAEGLGQITGLNTNARRLADPSYLSALVDAGLDHIQITLESHDPRIHDEMVNTHGAWKQTTTGLKNALDSPLYVMTNTTMLKNNQDVLGDTLDFLHKTGVPTVGLNALIYAGKGKEVGTGLNENELQHLLEVAKRKTESSGQRLIWYTPTQYCRFNPLDMGLGVKGCTAALYNMCIEPNGEVLPCQSYYQSLGHILEDPWDDIWNHDLAVYIRERKYVPAACQNCSLLPECGGGCPLALNEHAEDVHPENLIPAAT
ncbi:MAG: radical SAM protein [Anaerolineales bacterium]